MSARYDINANQGETLNLHLYYTDVNDNAIDLSTYSAEMKVRRSFMGDSSLLHFTTTGLTAGITGATSGVTGGLFLNKNAGNTGSQTGGILIIAGATATSLVPYGKHLYDLEIRGSTGDVTRLIEGRFDVSGENTR